jgi:hypothetical protein
MTCCKTSYALCDSIPACVKQLIIKTPVISASVTLRFSDKFGKVYYVTKTADSQGEITIQLILDSTVDPALSPDLPIALLNEYAGEFRVMAYDAAGAQKQWTISGIQYDALIISVKNITPVVASYTIDTTYAGGLAGQFNL